MAGARGDLVRTLDAMDTNRDRRIFLRADRAVAYGDMMDVLEVLRASGYAKVALVALEGRGASAAGSAPVAAKP